jgi:hypothetical protein
MNRVTAISTDTCEKLLLDAGVVYVDYDGVGERILGVTDGGNTFEVTQEVREIPCDGKFGDKYKKLKRITSRDASLTVNLKEISAANIKLCLIGSTESTAVSGNIIGEYLGVGTTETTGYKNFTATKKNISSTVKLNKNGVRQTWTQGVDFALTTESTSNIRVKESLITTSDDVSASYTYLTTSTGIYHDIYAKGTIADAEYQNITLLALISGSTTPVLCYLTNAITEGNLNMGLNDKEEAVIELKFHAHWTATMDHNECPFGIKYPK